MSFLTKEKEAELEAVFKTYDQNGDGLITSIELKQAFSKLGQTLTDDDITAMMSQADTDKNGKIDKREFMMMMMKLAEETS